MKGEIPKTQEKTQNSRKKLKLWEDFAPPERPSGVIKKPALACPCSGFLFGRFSDTLENPENADFSSFCLEL